jgi:hypothetical protein
MNGMTKKHDSPSNTSNIEHFNGHLIGGFHHVSSVNLWILCSGERDFAGEFPQPNGFPET